MTYDDLNQKSMQFLDPVVKKKVQELLSRLDMINEDILIVSGFRTKEEQDNLYAQGRTKPGNVVTWVRGGDSMHNYGVAVDVVPVGPLGGLKWNRKDRYETVAKIAMELGFDWGLAMWGVDAPHFQYTQGLSLNDLKGGRRPKDDSEDETLSSKLKKAERALKRTRNQMRLRRLKRFINRARKRLNLLKQKDKESL